MSGLPPTGRLLALDWGERRIGIALSDESQLLARPLDTLVRRAGKRFPLRRFLELVEQHHPTGLVVGLPLTPGGLERDSAAAARELATRVQQATGLPVLLWDERLTTARALQTVRLQGGTVRGRREEVDALAASILLQHVLDSRRHGVTPQS